MASQVNSVCLQAFLLLHLIGATQNSVEASVSTRTGTSSSETALLNIPKDKGEYYQAGVPDTIDLAERAKYALAYFDSIAAEELGLEMYFGADLTVTDPPVLGTNLTAIGACQCKALEAIAMLHLMTGFRNDMAKESLMVNMMVSLLGEDGLYWIPGDVENKPWHAIPEPFAMVHGQGRMMRAMIAWYQYTGDAAWKDRIDRLVDGLDKKLVVHKDDYAYFPTRGFYDEEYLRSCYTEKGWKATTEPPDEKSGEEGSLFNHQGHIPGALATWYQMTGNRDALRLAGELVRFLTKPKFWADWKGGEGEYPGVNGSDHAHWEGHYIGHLNTLRAILEYAVAANDTRLMHFAREGYEWARRIILSRIGFGGGCCPEGRLVGLAVKLTENGIGDYWEDVDFYVRNHLAELQFVPDDLEYIHSLCQGKPAPPPDSPGSTSKDMPERIIGSFSGAHRPNKSCNGLCCSPHGSMGLFYAWDSAVRFDGDVARINLLLNRASPWLDMDSYLPYQGKVVIRNKIARELFVRIPLWVDAARVTCRKNEQPVESISWHGRYLRVGSLTRNDQVIIEFPMDERTETWTLWNLFGRPPEAPNPQAFSCLFRGNTLLRISPPLLQGSPLYQKDPSKFRTDRVPTRVVERFITTTRLKW